MVRFTSIFVTYKLRFLCIVTSFVIIKLSFKAPCFIVEEFSTWIMLFKISISIIVFWKTWSRSSPWFYLQPCKSLRALCGFVRRKFTTFLTFFEPSALVRTVSFKMTIVITCRYTLVIICFCLKDKFQLIIIQTFTRSVLSHEFDGLHLRNCCHNGKFRGLILSWYILYNIELFLIDTNVKFVSHRFSSLILFSISTGSFM